MTKAKYEMLMVNPIFKTLIYVLAQPEVQKIVDIHTNNTFFQQSIRLAQWLNSSYPPDYIAFEKWWRSQGVLRDFLDEGYNDNPDSLEAQVFIFFEAMIAMQNAKVGLIDQVNNALFKSLVNSTGKKLYVWLQQNNITHPNALLEPSIFSYVNQKKYDSFRPSLHGFQLTDSIASLKLNIKFFQEMQNDIAYLNEHTVDLDELKIIIKKWTANFQNSLQFLSSLPNENDMNEGNIEKILKKFYKTWHHFKYNTDFLSNYSNLLLIIDRWYSESLNDQDLNRLTTLQDIESAYNNFLLKGHSPDFMQVGYDLNIQVGYDLNITFLNYLFTRIYKQQYYILSGRSQHSEKIEKRVAELDFEIELVLQRCPDLLGNLSNYFWSHFDSPNFFNPTTKIQHIAEEAISPRCGSPIGKT